ncbi:MAG: hypothetical protein QNJ72_31135 [Pleurocapsa sp. MO_226.B13]|nr:hypothetical protein [Pleurocapsa sp. MO_226.B13]
MGKNAKRKQDTITIECVTNIVYENIASVLKLDAENNYQQRKQVSLEKLKRVYSKLSPKRKAKYITIECLGCIEICMQKNLPEFKFQYAALTTNADEKRKLENLIRNWQELKKISFLEISEFLVPPVGGVNKRDLIMRDNKRSDLTPSFKNQE